MDWSETVRITGHPTDGALHPEEAARIDAASFEVTRAEWRRFLFETVIEDADPVMRSAEIYGGARQLLKEADSGRISGFLQAVFRPEEERRERARLIEIAEAAVRLIDACDAVGVRVVGVEGGVFREPERAGFSEPAP